MQARSRAFLGLQKVEVWQTVGVVRDSLADHGSGVCIASNPGEFQWARRRAPKPQPDIGHGKLVRQRGDVDAALPATSAISVDPGHAE
jgi:hypothetical protein